MIEEVWQMQSSELELGQINICDGVIVGGCPLAQHYVGVSIDDFIGHLARQLIPLHVTSRIVVQQPTMPHAESD